MNTVHQGLKEYALNYFTDETDQRNTYDNYAIDYLPSVLNPLLSISIRLMRQ